MCLRLLELIFFLYFALHIPVIIFIDLQMLLPEHMYPQMLKDLLHWYTTEFRDPMILEPPIWCKTFIISEALVQLPFFPVAAYAFLKGSCKWIRTPVLVYSAHSATKIMPILFHVYLHEFEKAPNVGPRTIEERYTLVAIYSPYIIIPFMLILTMMCSSTYNTPVPSETTSTKAKKLK